MEFDAPPVSSNFSISVLERELYINFNYFPIRRHKIQRSKCIYLRNKCQDIPLYSVFKCNLYNFNYFLLLLTEQLRSKHTSKSATFKCLFVHNLNCTLVHVRNSCFLFAKCMYLSENFEFSLPISP